MAGAAVTRGRGGGAGPARTAAAGPRQAPTGPPHPLRPRGRAGRAARTGTRAGSRPAGRPRRLRPTPPGAGAEARGRTAVSTIDRHRRHVPGAGRADGRPPHAWSAARPLSPGRHGLRRRGREGGHRTPPIARGGDTERGGRRRRAPSDRLIVHHRRPTRPFSRGDGAPTVSASPSADPRDWRAPFITVVNIRLSALRLPRALRWLYKNQAHLSFAHRPFLPPCIYAITRPSRLTGPFFPGETALERSAAHTLGLLLSNEALESYSQPYD